MKWLTGLIILILASAAGGQTTRPAPAAPWPAAVQRFAEAVAQGNTAAAAAMIDPMADVRAFHGTDGDINSLLAGMAGGTLLGAHPYLYPPLAVGADVAADFKNAVGVPDDIKQRMIPQDDDAMKRANATAVQWLGDILGAKQDDPIAVIVFWRPARDKENLLGSAAPRQVLLIILKGKDGGGGKFHIVQCRYGNPLPAGVQ